MGFTRYWTLKKEIPQDKYKQLSNYSETIVNYEMSNGIKIGRLDGDGGEPEFTDEIIAFNGVGDDSHESFVIPRTPEGDGWDFCKTAIKPYDKVVYGILYLTYKFLGDEYFSFSGDDGCDSENIDDDQAYDVSQIDKILNRDKKISEIVD